MELMKETKRMEVMKEKVGVMMVLGFGSGSELGSSFLLDSKVHLFSSSLSVS